eukprot:12180575-Ditylum_brightwellii.AAC.1
MTNNNLVDAYKHMHPELHPTTYLQGPKRLPSDYRISAFPHRDFFHAVDPAVRKLKSSNPRRVVNYMDSLETFFTNQNILQRVLKLQQDYMNQNYNSVKLNKRYGQLDRIITEGMLLTEKSCCRSKHGYVSSIKLARAGKLV